MVMEMKMEKEVTFLGFRRDVERFYSIIDVLACPSLGEALGNVCLEAMAFGKPVVASHVGGIPEVVQDGATGILVPPKDSRGLAQAILRLLSERELANRMGMAGRERVKSAFSQERLIHEVEEIYYLLVR